MSVVTASPRRDYRRALGIQQTEMWVASELGTLRHPLISRCANGVCSAPVDEPGGVCRWCASFDADLAAQSAR